jgi:hypothetical protein
MKYAQLFRIKNNNSDLLRLNAEESKRRTLQRSDIGNGIKKVDMFDFLVDIIPRDDKPIKNEKVRKYYRLRYYKIHWM